MIALSHGLLVSIESRRHGSHASLKQTSLSCLLDVQEAVRNYLQKSGSELSHKPVWNSLTEGCRTSFIIGGEVLASFEGVLE